LRVVDERIYVLAQPMIGMQHQGSATAQDPVGDSVPLLLELLEADDGPTQQ